MTAVEFAARERLDPQQLRWWKWQLGRSATATAPKRATLVPVHVVPVRPKAVEAPPGTAVEIALPTGVRLRVPSGVDEATLVGVLRALEAVCC